MTHVLPEDASYGYICILWTDRMDVPSKCTIVRTVG
jgi:hypothetical protein